MVDIENLGINDIVLHDKHGRGFVISCSERPSVKIKFTDGKSLLFTNINKEELKYA